MHKVLSTLFFYDIYTRCYLREGDGFVNKWLIKKFVLDKSADDKKEIRLLCGKLSGTTGIIMYLTFGAVKIVLGLITGSFAIIADAIHNLADAMASIATLIGFSMANKASDREHPFGHARIEYMTGFIISAIIIGVGIELCITGFEKILNPGEMDTNMMAFIFIVVITCIAFWFYRLNISLSKLIGSASLKATGVEARNDAMTNFALLAVILLDNFAGVNIDGYVGFAFGAIIIYSGIKMVKETAGPLLGQSPDPESVRSIADLVLKQEGVLGIHDLIVHDYGPGNTFASIHIEVDSRENIFKSHTLIDSIERKAHEELKIVLTGHMDPLDTKNPEIRELHETLKKALSSVKGFQGMHDLRIVSGTCCSNVIFDVVAAHDEPEKTFKKVEKVAQETLTAIDPTYKVVINRDLDYSDAVHF